jgi:hypothetical protein
MSARSVEIKFVNDTDYELDLVNAKLSHGEWVPNRYPPEKIHPMSTVEWGSESKGFMTGTEGLVTYSISAPAKGNVEAKWDNPYAGPNGYGHKAPKDFTLTHTAGHGDNAKVTFTLKKTG